MKASLLFYQALVGLLISGITVSNHLSSRDVKAAQLTDKLMASKQVAEEKPITLVSNFYFEDIDASLIEPAKFAEESIVLKEERHTIIHSTTTCGGGCSGCCRGYVVERIAIKELEPEYGAKEIQVAEIIYEEPIKIDYEVNTYPNPFNVQATLEIENYDGEPYMFAMFDLSGKLIDLRESITDNRLTISRGDLAPGIYVWKLVTASESQVKSGKLVVQ